MGKTASPRTETSYQAVGADELAQHSEVPGSATKVKGGVVQLAFAFLSGETCADPISDNVDGHRAGVSRGHSTAGAQAGRPELDGCVATPASGLLATNPTGEATEADAGRKHGRAQSDLLDRILSRENMLAAWARVKANNGAPGIDGMSIEAFPTFARQHWDRIRSALYAGSYRPAAVRRVMIAKATGGQRPLGIPTVLDRLIQQAISQIIAPLFEEVFHAKSFGFRPERRARQALAEMERAHADGYRFAVDCDLKSFFDTVSHDLLLARLRRKIADERVIRLIGHSLRAGVQLPEGNRRPTLTGVPQGSPLSPLLANVMLNDLDWELDRRGLRFARYADDFLVFVKSRRAAERVLGSVRRFVERRLKLVVNRTKSKAAQLSHCTFLGFRLSRGKLRWTDSAVARFKDRVREITSRSSGRSMAWRIAALRRYVIGWLNYFGHSHSYREVLELDAWLRRRVRLCYWKDWKRPRPRRKRLLALGADPSEVHLATRSRKGYWRMSKHRIVQQALSNRWLWQQGLPNMKQQWIALHYGSPSK